MVSVVALSPQYSGYRRAKPSVNYSLHRQLTERRECQNVPPLLAIFESGAFHGLAHTRMATPSCLRVAGGMNFMPPFLRVLWLADTFLARCATRLLNGSTH